MKYNTWCPLFPGFYETVFQYNSEESDIQSYNEEHNTDFNYDSFEWDYKDYEKRVGKEFAARVEKELKQFLPIKIEFQEISSPREYNFRNDSINISVSISLHKLLKLIKDRKEQAISYFDERYSSRSGFIPFHSNNIENWLNKEYILEQPEHRVGALLDCLCSIEIDNENIIYWADSETGYINYTPKEIETADKLVRF